MPHYKLRHFKLNDKKLKTIVQIGMLFVSPVVLLYFGIIPIQYRFFILLAVTFIATGIVIAEKWSLKEIGIRLDNLKKSIMPYLILTIIATAA